MATRAKLSGGDRRQVERIDALLRASLHVEDLAPASSMCTGHVRDLSDHGARIVLRRRVPVGTRVVLDMECEIPLHVHLGFDADALVVDGPMHTHLVRVAGTVNRCIRLPNRRCEIGVEFNDDLSRFDELQVLRFYVDHLRESSDDWAF